MSDADRCDAASGGWYCEGLGMAVSAIAVMVVMKCSSIGSAMDGSTVVGSVVGVRW
jgi:hypothetical protein